MSVPKSRDSAVLDSGGAESDGIDLYAELGFAHHLNMAILARIGAAQ